MTQIPAWTETGHVASHNWCLKPWAIIKLQKNTFITGSMHLKTGFSVVKTLEMNK